MHRSLHLTLCLRLSYIGGNSLWPDENPTRQQPMLTTMMHAGVVPSLEAWSWPKSCLPISGARGDPRSGSLVWMTMAPQCHSLLEDIVLVTRGVCSLRRVWGMM
jgi:hypothetical protein